MGEASYAIEGDCCAAAAAVWRRPQRTTASPTKASRQLSLPHASPDMSARHGWCDAWGEGCSTLTGWAAPGAIPKKKVPAFAVAVAGVTAADVETGMGDRAVTSPEGRDLDRC